MGYRCIFCIEVMFCGSAKRTNYDVGAMGKSTGQGNFTAGVSPVCAESDDAANGAANAVESGAGICPRTGAAGQSGTSAAAIAKSVT